MMLEIPEDVAQRLEALAKQNETDVGDFLRELILRHEIENHADGEEKPLATLADLARHAKHLNMASPEPVNTAERSREILNTEYAEYLKSRIDR